MNAQQPNVVTVQSCTNCPFVVLTQFIPHWCKRGAKIVNAYRIPDDCPLRKGDITVKLSDATMLDNTQ